MGVDLSTPGGREAHQAAILTVLEVCRKTNKIPGIASGDDAQRWFDLGFLFVTAVGDSSLVQKGAQESRQRFGR